MDGEASDQLRPLDREAHGDRTPVAVCQDVGRICLGRLEEPGEIGDVVGDRRGARGPAAAAVLAAIVAEHLERYGESRDDPTPGPAVVQTPVDEDYRVAVGSESLVLELHVPENGPLRVRRLSQGSPPLAPGRSAALAVPDPRRSFLPRGLARPTMAGQAMRVPAAEGESAPGTRSLHGPTGSESRGVRVEGR
jgi:hypothetical protein